MYDVAIIGAGIIGAAITRELSRYDLGLVLIEKDSDIANGTTKANSAIVHAGFDPKPGTLKARFNVEGNRLFAGLCRELDVPFKQIGSLVIAFSDEELQTLQELLAQGRDLGVPGLEIVNRTKLHRIEPGLSDQALGALYAPTAGITDPYLLAIALAESAVENGAEVRRESAVTGITGHGEFFNIHCGQEKIAARLVINAAGLYADRVSEMINSPSFKITPYRGEYFLLDKDCGELARHVLFPCPTALGKGVLISPTAHGNLIVGPNSEEAESRQSTETTTGGLAYVRENAQKIKKDLPLQKVITSFSGLRAKADRGDFIIEESAETKGFFNFAGIESPGLVSAPAIACYAAELLQHSAGPFRKKKTFRPLSISHTPFMALDEREKVELIEKDPRFGRIICRCESVTEGEIVRAIHSPVGARTLDGIKKRTRPGGGRCQGGFCGPRVMQILACELGRELPEINKDNPGSYILTGPTKGKKSRPQEKAPQGPFSQKGRGPEQESGSSGVPAGTTSSLPAAEGKDPAIDFNGLVVVGGGPAGMAAAVAAYDSGIREIMVIERDREPGGILQQCIHNGFGLHYFREELTGPEYAEKFIDMLKDRKIACKLDTMVLSIGADRTVTYLNNREGPAAIRARAIVLAMGCRERTRGAINIPGTRPAGIFSAGTAQRLVNIEGYLVGRKVVVFGSGDIGLIMARRMVLEGAEVVAVLERKPYSEGLVRNYVQCIEDYGIPMLLKHTIVNIRGRERVEGVTIARTDEKKEPIPGTESDLECDTILFSRGLIPENELSRSAGIALDPATGGPVVNEAMETGVEGIFACGNVVHVHDLVDWVTAESIRAGKAAAAFIKSGDEEPEEGFTFKTRPLDGISYIVPQMARSARIGKNLDLYMRVRGHHRNALLQVKAGEKLIKAVRKKVLTPGEMTEIKIKKADLPKEPFRELTVKLAEEGGQ